MSSVNTSGPRNDNYYMKIVITGDLGVGKTFLVSKYVHDKVPTRQNSIPNSVRQSQWTKDLLYRGKPTKIHIWDTAGQEKYRSLTASYYRNAHGCLILFDVTKQVTFDNVKYWHEDLKVYSSQTELCTMLIGTKCHVEESQREVPRERAEKYAESIGVPYMEVSAEKGINVTEAFEKLADLIIDSLQRRPEVQHQVSTTRHISSTESLKKQWCTC